MSGSAGGRRKTGDTAVATEIELKLRFPPKHLREVLALPLLAPASRMATRKLAATYFDTPTLDLSRRHIALRVRREGRRWVQAVKGGGSTASGVHQRLEIETTLNDRHPDLSLLPRHPVTRILKSKKIVESLLPVLHTEITRSLRLLEPVPGVLVEVAIDRGFIRSGRRRQQVCEIELELKRGPVTALFDLAQQLAEVVPLALEHQSKAERGYALFCGAGTAPAKAVPLALVRDMTAGQGFLAIAAATLAQVHANERGVLGSDNPEYLHQMRVGIRRLRSAFSLFREMLGDAAAPQAAALRAMAGALGPARDWDVFVTETLPMVRPALAAHVAADRFEALCRRRWQAARAKSKKSIKSNTYNESMIALSGWLAALGGDGNAAWQQPVRDCAVQILAARHARVLKRGRRLEQRPAAELHRLRIAVKQLRYATEFFATLFAERGMATLRDRLVLLQDILGRINDAAAVQSLLNAAATDDREFIAATGIVTGWCEARAAAERRALQNAWRRFRAAPRPWQK
ncbi:MAG: CHAD domain-containing protein [Burkholderiales bacterium]|jgi:inorganic triphosphatase YgiF|nr:CHAD domain-containing protein [Burkholderiales bacterium]